MALPQRITPNQPNLNRGLGSVANDNTASQNDIANRLAVQRAQSSARQNRLNNSSNSAQVIPFSNPGNSSQQNEPQQDDENPYEDYNLAEEEEESNQAMLESQQRQAATTAASSAAVLGQQQINQQQQRQRAASLMAQKQTQLRNLQSREQQLDAETQKLLQDLGTFKNSKAKRYIAFFKPNITFIIERIIADLKKQASRLTYRKKIAFLTTALMTLGLFLATLKGARFILAFADATISWIRWIIYTIETIIIPIILLISGFFIIPFAALVFYIGRIPMFKGKMTQQVIEMIEKTKEQQKKWQAELATLRKIVANEDEVKALQNSEKQVQKQA